MNFFHFVLKPNMCSIHILIGSSNVRKGVHKFLEAQFRVKPICRCACWLSEWY